MDWLNYDYSQWIPYILLFLGIGLVLSLILVGVLIASIRRINIPPDADPITALRATPLIVVLTLDLLDFFLDFLSAPFSWILLGRLGLKPLRAVTLIESLIPGTQFIPTMTAAWIIARFIRRGGEIEKFVGKYTRLDRP
jgi:hypothetical protein